AVRAAGEKIARDYAGRDLLLVGLLDGAVFFFADLARAIPRPVDIALLRARSYGAGTSSSGAVALAGEVDVAGREVLIVEDIYDSGRTLTRVRDSLAAQQPRSLEIAALLVKDVARAAAVEVRYALLTVPTSLWWAPASISQGAGATCPTYGWFPKTPRQRWRLRRSSGNSATELISMPREAGSRALKRQPARARRGKCVRPPPAAVSFGSNLPLARAKFPAPAASPAARTWPSAGSSRNRERSRRSGPSARLRARAIRCAAPPAALPLAPRQCPASPAAARPLANRQPTPAPMPGRR